MALEWRSYYLRTHLANGRTKWMEGKHRCSQMQFRSLGLGCSGADCSSQEGAWRCRSFAGGVNRCCKTSVAAVFTFHPFLWKPKSSSDFFWLGETDANVGFFVKVKCYNRWKLEMLVFLNNLHIVLSVPWFPPIGISSQFVSFLKIEVTFSTYS